MAASPEKTKAILRTRPMCGIGAGIAQREVSPILLEGLRRLEYRGYDSAGMAVLETPGRLKRIRTLLNLQAT